MFTGYVAEQGWVCERESPTRRWKITDDSVFSADREVICELRAEITEAGHRWLRICSPGGGATDFFVFHGFVYGPTVEAPWAEFE